jgi:hypothetical protein
MINTVFEIRVANDSEQYEHEFSRFDYEEQVQKELDTSYGHGNYTIWFNYSGFEVEVSVDQAIKLAKHYPDDICAAFATYSVYDLTSVMNLLSNEWFKHTESELLDQYYEKNYVPDKIKHMLNPIQKEELVLYIVEQYGLVEYDNVFYEWTK